MMSMVLLKKKVGRDETENRNDVEDIDAENGQNEGDGKDEGDGDGDDDGEEDGEEEQVNLDGIHSTLSYF